ncbi:hypothetical protein [Neorickettsia risticii]|nr:hypothetical protein [Neorickettsia risticii]
MQSSRSFSPLRATTSLMDFIVEATEQNFSYEEALLILKEAADADREIVWRKDEQGKKITRYDPLAAQNERSQSRKLFSSHDYLQQAINMFRGADEIVAAVVDNPVQGELRSWLKRRALIILTAGLPRYNEKACQELLKTFNTEVCKILQRHALPSLTLKKVSALLRKAESYAPLGDAHHYSVETVTRIGNNIIFQADVPVTETTENQKRLLQDYETQAWYQSLHPVEQALFRRHVGALTDSKHIPSVYLRGIPCLRNGYRKVLTKFTIDDSGNITGRTPLTSYTHSASLAATQEHRQLRLQLASENYQQLCRANPGKNVSVLTLCARVPLQGFIDRFCPKLSSNILDTYVVDTTESAVGRENTHVIPINALRFISKNTISKTCDKLIGEYVQRAGISMNPQYQDLLRYLTQNTSTWSTRAYRHACDSITNLPTREERALAKEMVELRRLELKQGGFLGRLTSLFEVLTSAFRSTPRNRNARIAAKVTALWEQVCDNEVLCVSCKSGKDRTGYVTTSADAIASAMYTPELQLGTIQGALVRNGHTQFLASHSGGKTGCFGLKPVQVDAVEGIGGENCSSLFTSAARSSSSISLVDTHVTTGGTPDARPRFPLKRTRTESTTSSSDSLCTLSSRTSSASQEEHPDTGLIDLTVQRGIESQQQASQSARK